MGTMVIIGAGTMPGLMAGDTWGCGGAGGPRKTLSDAGIAGAPGPSPGGPRAADLEGLTRRPTSPYGHVTCD